MISFAQKYSIWAARIAIAIIYIWFGALKVIGLSPATTLVQDLLNMTMPFMNPDTFVILFGLFEVLIGVLFLFKKADKVALALLAFHLITTMMPLVLLPGQIWTSPFTPTLEGQYIIKNVALMAAALTILAGMKRSDSMQ